ncbi:hypothetical protein BXY82_2580 [Gelidibacter sediminis]|uniref:SpoIIAA-like protein n=1 Tax=Gelidibacter sediminis TaxID=1608710 RepID=A0A4R7Q1N8_9FLAO|nr:hypothetical protein [Gelidibacter sediminis]TDU40529.1 hypothetical protein BXY82_2580 [Gelidibacter sediminis]
MGLITYYDFEDSEAFVFDHYIINQVKEGAVIGTKHNTLLHNCIKKHFSGKNLVYISNRARSYAVNPLVYPKTKKIPNLVAIAIVANSPLTRQNAAYEGEFFDKPYQIFDNLRAAINWSHLQLEAEEKQSFKNKT